MLNYFEQRLTFYAVKLRKPVLQKSKLNSDNILLSKFVPGTFPAGNPRPTLAGYLTVSQSNPIKLLWGGYNYTNALETSSLLASISLVQVFMVGIKKIPFEFLLIFWVSLLSIALIACSL